MMSLLCIAVQWDVGMGWKLSLCIMIPYMYEYHTTTFTCSNDILYFLNIHLRS